MTTQRREAAGDGARPRRRPGCGASTCRSTPCAPRCSGRSPGATTSTGCIAGIDAALDAGLDPVKVNCVVIRGVNDDEVVDLAAFGRERGVGVRFIEFMPLDADGAMDVATRSCPRHEILERIDAVFPLERLPVARAHHSEHVEPAERFRYADGIGDVGVIASVTEPFCEQLRPDPHHRRGQAPHLPVRARRVRPASASCGAARPTTSSTTCSRPRSRGPSARSGPGTASARSTSCARDRSMSQIGG